MNAPKTSTASAAEWFSVLARWLLGGTFLYLGAHKALHPVDFLKLLREYDLVHHYWYLNAIAAALPWLEIFCGLLLLAGIAVRGTALVAFGLLTTFTAAIFHRALSLAALKSIAFCAVKFDCGCGNGEVFACHKLTENSCLLLLAVWLVLSQSHKLCLRPQL